MLFTTLVLEDWPQGYILSYFFNLLRVLSLSPPAECLLNFLWLVYSTMFGKIFSIYGVHILWKCIESMHFYLCPPVFHSKLQVEVFENLFPPRRKGWRKLWFALSKFNQKILKWLGTLGFLYFAWFTIFFAMALQFWK